MQIVFGIAQKIEDLSKLLHESIMSQTRNDMYLQADIGGCRQTENEHSEKIEVNTSDISDNRDGIVETFEGTMVNTEDISALREGLEEVYELLLNMEG